MFLPYKAQRDKRELTKREKAFEKAFRKQMELLRTEYLRIIGFHNNFWQDGYESDDIIASVTKSLVLDLEEGIIITADQDLYQLIRPNVKWYNPRSRILVSLQRFKREFGIRPKQWAKVKAIAGCKSDNVLGVKGVGEKTALLYVKGELNESHKKYRAIKANWKSVVLRNKPLVLLPFKGTKSFALTKDFPTQKGWNKVTKALGMANVRYKDLG
jgi:5'-3' exonuclease